MPDREGPSWVVIWGLGAVVGLIVAIILVVA